MLNTILKNLYLKSKKMNKKTLIRYLSMLPLFIGLLLSACSSSNNDRAEDKSGISDNRVEVIYFHGNMRCLTCKAIEKFAKETVDSMYPDEVKNGKLRFRVVSILDNEKMADDYQTTGSSLFVTTYINGIEKRTDMTEFGFKTARKRHEYFQDSLSKVIRQSLNDMNP